MTLPGWDSIEAADWWSSFYFWLGIVALFVLGGSEIIAHRYGLRKDELVAIAEKQTQTNHNAETAGIRQQLSEAQAIAKSSADELKRITEPRHLTDAQKKSLFETLKGSTGSLTIQATVTASDAEVYAEEIANILRSLNWHVEVTNVIAVSANRLGAWISVKGPTIPATANLIFGALKAAQIPVIGQAYADGNVPDGETWLTIGGKN